MKIITWNCNGALRKKYHYLSEMDADIYLVQECEDPRESNDIDYKNWAKNYFWIGDSKNRGLAVFAKENILLEKLNWTSKYEDHSVKHFLPCSINKMFNLLAVWTHRNNSPNFGYIGQFWKYLQVHKESFKNIIIAGDFNSNVIWDQWDRWWNHSDVLRELNDIGIKSLYHEFTGEKQGSETQPTFYLQRNLSKAYHIDYAFGSSEFINKMKKIELGKVEEWLTISDHLPLICQIDFPLKYD